VLITVITRAEFNEFKQIMKQVDPGAFVSVSENVSSRVTDAVLPSKNACRL
ncbi:DUF2179 domain-containing protein, partial [Mycobacterium tuberculosis]|nr:DUF2179 domain-containing protein [Mycobacterium tuberculosis]